MEYTRARSILRATLSIAVTAVLAVGLSVAGAAAPAQAQAMTLCKGYEGCADYGMTNHGYAAANKNMYWRMYGGHNCTNYAAYMMVKAGLPNVRPWTNATGNASGWGVGMKSKTNTTPAVGSIAWWTPGSGHVAYVEAVLSPTEIIISEDSWGGDFYWRIINKANGGWPKGFIHFKDRSATSVPEFRAKPMSTAIFTDAARTKPATTTLMDPGVTYYVEQNYLNTGIGSWTGLQLTTASPQLHDSALANASWINPGTPATQVQPLVGPGATATFRFSITIPAGLADGTAVSEQFTPTLTTGERIVYGTSTLAVTADSRNLFSAQPTPAISGTLLEDQVLTAATGTWRPASAAPTYSYRWLRNGEPISGATAATYSLTANDVGRTVSVTVTAKSARFITASKTSAATGIVASKHSNTLAIGQKLGLGEQIVSLNGRYAVIQQKTGALHVVDRFTGKYTWSNRMAGKASYTILTADGVLHSYSKSGKRVWSSKTAGKGVVDAYIASGGDFRLRSSDTKVLWQKG